MSTNEQILVEINSISTAKDFAEFVKKRITRSSSESVFPITSGTSVIDALLTKISDLAPLTLDAQGVEVDEIHPWLECVRQCAEASRPFCNEKSPGHAALHHRFVDVLTNCFVVEGKHSNASCFEWVAKTFARVILEFSCFSNEWRVRYPSGISEALLTYLLDGISYCNEFDSSRLTVHVLLRSASPRRRILQLVERCPNSVIFRDFYRYADAETFAIVLNEPELLRSLFRSMFVTRQSHCCTRVSRLTSEILEKFGSLLLLPPAFFNSPLNLPDESGANIEDTPLSIVCRGTRDCFHSPQNFCLRLIELGADVNGFVHNPDDANKKMVSRRDGKTPFMIACDFASDNVVKLFLKQPNLDLTLRDVDGLSAVNHLLRRDGCERVLLQLLYKRDPVLFLSHVTIEDLDYAVRHGIKDSVAFIFSLKNLRLDMKRLDELLKFCVEELIASTPRTSHRVHRTVRRCVYNLQAEEMSACTSSTLHYCLCKIAAKLRELGCDQVSFSVVGRRQRLQSTEDDEEEMKKPELRSGDDDDDEDEEEEDSDDDDD